MNKEWDGEGPTAVPFLHLFLFLYFYFSSLAGTFVYAPGNQKREIQTIAS